MSPTSYPAIRIAPPPATTALYLVEMENTNEREQEAHFTIELRLVEQPPRLLTAKNQSWGVFLMKQTPLSFFRAPRENK